MTKTEILKLFIAVIIFAAVIAVVAVLGRIDTAQTIQLIITFVLVLVTVAYVMRTTEIAKATRQQADASVKMAKEMKQQRYDAVRPIVDIVIKEQSITAQESISQGYGDKPKDLPCQLRNVGVGPAIRVYSFIKDIDDPDGNPRRWDFGILPSAAREGEMEYTQEMRLLLMQKDNQRALVAHYEDVYGNTFESIREVNLDEVIRSRGPVKICRKAKKETKI